jgi:hypothetical protein
MHPAYFGGWLLTLGADFLFEILEARGDVLLEILEAGGNVLLGLLDPFFDHLKARVRTSFDLLDALVYRAGLVGQSPNNSDQKGDDQGDQLPDGLTYGCADDLIKLMNVSADFGQLLALRFNCLSQGCDFRIECCGHVAPWCEPRISRAL